jgi:hypothetical protein
MKNDDLISVLRQRAEDPTRRTDALGGECPELASPATPQALADAERVIGCALHPLHRQLLEEVANGGFGPGNGLIGLPGGRLDAHGRSALELRETLRLGTETPLPRGVMPLFDLGDGAWLCIDESTPDATVLVFDELGLTEVGEGLGNLLSAWVHGANVTERLFDSVQAPGINPFTRKPMTYTSRGRAKGVPYRAQ